MSSTVEDFLTTAEEREVIAAIRSAEKRTSGEIRVHIERGEGKDALKRAQEVFHLLKMDNTKEENGVLIYIAVDEHTFAICGDRGIDGLVPDGFWDSTKNTIATHFAKGAFKDGLVAGILEAGKELREHFPWKHNDADELPNEISKG